MVGALLKKFVQTELKGVVNSIAREFTHAAQQTALVFGKKPQLQPALLGVNSRGQNVGTQSLRERFQRNILKMDNGDSYPGGSGSGSGGGGGGGGGGIGGGLAALLAIGTVFTGLGALVVAIPGCGDLFYGISGQTPPDYGKRGSGKRTTSEPDSTGVKTNNANMLGK